MGMILIVIFAVSLQMVGIISVPMQGVSDRQELQVNGEKVIAQILSLGSPSNWGDILNNTSPSFNFGLAKQGNTTRGTYVLDVNKVQRLNLNHPYNLDTVDVQKALNIERTYGFAIQLTPVFDITVRKISTDIFKVDMHWKKSGFPVSNANVTAQMFYLENVSRTVKLFGNGKNSTIGINGTTQTSLDFTGANPGLKVLVVMTDYIGARAYYIYDASDYSNRTILAIQIKDNLLIDNQYNSTTSNPTLYEVLSIKTSQPGNLTNYNFKLITVNTTLSDQGNAPPPAGSFRRYTIDNPEQMVTGIIVVQNMGGIPYLAFTNSTFGDYTFNTSPGLTVFPPGIQLDRLVSIEDSLYDMRLNLWRMSQ